ncbi:MAG: translation initiation factor IF-3 [Candidatus Bruticola sp.]
MSKELRTNRQIRVPRVFVIDEEGHQLGQMSTREALEKAQAHNLDLVEVNPTARPPVCRFMDYGKYKYVQSKSERDSRAKRKPQELREVKVRPKIDDHDFEVKIKTIDRLIRSGDRVKVTLRFRGREIVHMELAKELLKSLYERVQDIAMIAQKATMDGRQMVMVLAPRTGPQAQAKPKAVSQSAVSQTPASDASKPEAQAVESA